MARRLVGLVVVLAAAACGIDESGLLEPDAAQPGIDSGVDAPAQNDVVVQDAPPDVPAPPIEAGVCDEDASYCQSPDVPSGWQPVAYAENPATNCPTADWPTQTDVVANVANDTASCACDCTKTADPSCTTGTIATFYSSNASCGNVGVSLTFNNGACVNLNANIANYYSSTALAPFGFGSCTSQTKQSGDITSTPARLCAPETKCASAACAGKAPSGFLACIVADGDQACPSGSAFNQKHSIAASATWSCGQTCGLCSVTGTCDAPQVHFFSQNGCNNNSALVTLPSDGTCSATNHGGQFVGSANYTATPNFKCNPSGTSAVQVQPTTPRTVCCR